jgi:hypothetical protein
VNIDELSPVKFRRNLLIKPLLSLLNGLLLTINIADHVLPPCTKRSYSPFPPRGRAVIALMIGTSFAAAAAFLWYGRNALHRIERWGNSMNEQDALFKGAATHEELADYAPAPELQKEPAKAIRRVHVAQETHF